MPDRVLIDYVLERTKEFKKTYTIGLQNDEPILSHNRVTGASVNFPIQGTCQPTRVCSDTCYYAKHPTRWDANLLKQIRVYNEFKQDWLRAAHRVVYEYYRGPWGRLPFLRWNGGGDLFPESVKVINWIGEHFPDVHLWVATRIPELAAQIEDAPNVVIHFSLDRSSLQRANRFIALRPRNPKYFFSYQSDRRETLPEYVRKCSVVFFDGYNSQITGDGWRKPNVCPLNYMPSVNGVCARCQRCFSGRGVRMRLELEPSLGVGFTDAEITAGKLAHAEANKAPVQRSDITLDI